jgi:predicted amidohydrolase
MRIALWQTARGPEELEQAAKCGADLLLCPELWPTGYVKTDGESADGPTARLVSRIAAKHKIGIAYGYAERDGGLFNSLQMFGKDGTRLAHYRKTHLFGEFEKGLFTAGDRLAQPFTFAGRKLGLLICYDVEFPETVRKLRSEGAELILVPTAVTSVGRFVPDTLVPARAIESQLHIAYANHPGPEFCGLSCLCGPQGKIASAADGEELVMAGLDDDALRRAEARVPYWSDRRPELY